MEAHGLRNVGIAVGAAALAGALSIATMTGNPQRPAPPAPVADIAGPLAPAPIAAPPVEGAPGAQPSEPVFETAAAPESPPATTQNISFIVRFQGNGPLGRAQALAGQGREAEARRAAQAALASQRSLSGLCLDRFTIGGAEMVLRPCGALPARQHAAFRARWLPRLRS